MSGVIDSINRLSDMFKCDAGVFEIKCGSSVLLGASGVKVNSFNANKSNDNWLFSADYTVDLEFYTSVSGYENIKKGSDSWSLEPMEEYVYSSFRPKVTIKGEYHNPLLRTNQNNSTTDGRTTGRSEAPNEKNPYPREQNDGGRYWGDVDLDIVSIPQFKLSRKLTAEGAPNGTSGNNGNCATGNYTAYINAKNWISKKLAEPFNGVYGSGGPTFNSNAMQGLNSFDKIFLYNHLRTINFSETEGTYEVNDTWLAMPTGMTYVEDYTIESSTDEKFIKTVSVQGTIKGLSFVPMGIMSGVSGLIPSGTGTSGLLSLDFATQSGTGSFSNSRQILDYTAKTSYDDKNFYGSKYVNAMSGWLNDIKPYLYRRAHLAMNSSERTETYISPARTPQPPPKNPIYCKENLLNIIPISTSETHDPRKGSITYNYQFNNKFTYITGVLAESISINDTGPADVINEAFVLGRRLGPVLQSLGAKTSAKKDLTFEVVVVPPSSWDGFFMTSSGCPLWTGGTVFKTITGIIEGFKPFGDRDAGVFGNLVSRKDAHGQVYVNKDDQSWNPTEGRYTRQISWTYQTCNITRSWMEN